MATYPPPNFIEPITVFNTSNWISSGETIDEAFLNANYLKFPVAQGTETLQAINVNGIATFNNDLIVSTGSPNNITIDNNITHFNANNALVISSNYGIQLDTVAEIYIGNVSGGNGTIIVVDDSASTMNLACSGTTTIGDYTGATTYLYMDSPNGVVDLYSATGSISLTSPNVISLNASPNGDITLFTGGEIRIGNIGGPGNQNELKINSTKMTTKTTNGFQLTDSTIQYASTYRTTGLTLGTTSTYSQTFNGSSLTATLPNVDGNNVGTQFLITNTNASALTVNTTGGQLIWSSITPASSTSRTFNTGHSHIFTAIRTTASNVYGWSMV